jgi:hypothetical protein
VLAGAAAAMARAAFAGTYWERCIVVIYAENQGFKRSEYRHTQQESAAPDDAHAAVVTHESLVECCQQAAAGDWCAIAMAAELMHRRV